MSGSVIPKTIHYCWFGGGKKPKLAEKCMASWRKYCPDYRLVEWNEENFDVNATAYTRYCYEHGKWAFLSDYVRLAAVYEQGGVYFDTDVELIAPIESLLENEAFFAFENAENVATGLGFGAVAGHELVKAMMASYAYPDRDSVRLIGCPTRNTEALLPYGLCLNGERQELAGALILPPTVMNPYDDPTGRLRLEKDTVSIHWYAKSAQSRAAVLRSRLTRPFHRLFGVDCFRWLKR